MRVPGHVIHRAFEAETVLLNLQTGQYHGLNHTAGLMFGALRDNGSVDAASRAIASELGAEVATVARDLEQLCVDLRARGLIELDDDTT